MQKFLKLLIISLLIHIPIVNASALRTETDELISKTASEATTLKNTLDDFTNYLNNNKTRVSNALDMETIEKIAKKLQANDYDAALGLLENALNDDSFNNMNIASKVDSYLALKQELITFVKANRSTLNIDTGTNEGIECSFDLFEETKSAFNKIKPSISSAVEAFGKIFVEVVKREINENNDVKGSEINALIDKYKATSSTLTATINHFVDSLDEYKEVFEIIGGSEGLFDVTIKNKFRNDLKKLLDDTESELKSPINDFIAQRWSNLENNVNDLIDSDKSVSEKNEIIYSKIDQVSEVNEKFVSAINEIIGDLDIESIKNKLNLILNRGVQEFDNAKEYLKDHLILGDYDINLITNHDSKININRAKEIIILDKLFTIEEFRRQIELVNGLGTLKFDFKSYSNVPNKATIKVTENNETMKEYKVIVKGDVNGNGNVTVTDVVMAAYYALDSLELDEEEVMAADVNSNNAITVTDVNLIAIRALEGNE